MDYAGILELSANEFQMAIAADVLKNKNIKGEQAAIRTNLSVAQSVRETLKKEGATMLEDVPLEDPIKVVAARVKERQKRLKGSTTI